MKVHILMDEPYHEPSELIAVYADRKKAEARKKRLQNQLEKWREKQHRLEDEGSDEAYNSSPPHYYDDLTIASMPVLPNK
jgi:hypothetical protein